MGAAARGDGTSARREMQGPAMPPIDMSSIFGMMGPPMPANTREPARRDEDEVSDIVSVDMGSETRDVNVRSSKKKAQKKKEVSL
jgi:hypothetical protein